MWKGRDYPAARVSLRSGDAEAFTVVDGETGSLLGLVERDRAYSTVHEGAVYLHLGEQYLVESLSLEDRVARRHAGPRRLVHAGEEGVRDDDRGVLERVERLGVELHFGRVSVTEQVVGYARKAVRDGSTIDVVPMLMPETTFETEAVWFSPEPGQLEGLEQMPKLLGTLHAAEHSLIALLPLWAMCDRWDIGGLSTNLHYQTGRPTIFVYDGHAGGVGITERGFDRFEDWVEDTARLLQRCPCAAGCPSCVQSPKCGNLNEPLDKAGARTLLERMLRVRVDFAARRSSSSCKRREGGSVQYMALIYGDEDAWADFTDEEREAAYDQYRAFGRDAEAQACSPAGTSSPSTRDATTVRVRDDETLVTDGPYAEVKEALGGFYLLECDSMDEALDWAARIPGAEHGAVEVRPVYVDPEEAQL